jgi:hypothetical protein
VTGPLLADLRRDLDQVPAASRVNITLVMFADPRTAAPLLTQALNLGDPGSAYATAVWGLDPVEPVSSALKVVWESEAGGAAAQVVVDPPDSAQP